MFIWCWPANTARVWSNPPMTPLPMPRKLCAHPGTYGTLTGYTEGRGGRKLDIRHLQDNTRYFCWDGPRIFQEFFDKNRDGKRGSTCYQDLPRLDGHCNLASYSIGKWPPFGCHLHFQLEASLTWRWYSTVSFEKSSGLSEPHICIFQLILFPLSYLLNSFTYTKCIELKESFYGRLVISLMGKILHQFMGSDFPSFHDFPMNHLLPSQPTCASGAWHLTEPINLPPLKGSP